MPEKTLKEKVERAWELLGVLPSDVEEIDEALTALEERVAELEKGRREWEEHVLALYQLSAKYKEATDDGK